LIIADRQRGFIRSRGTVRVPDGPGYNVTINVDARPTILSDGTLRVELSFEYQPRPGEHEAANVTSASPTAAPRFPGAEVLANPPSTLNQQVSVIVRSGQPLTISQAVDPASGRQTSVELKATILK